MMGHRQVDPQELYGGETAEEAATTLLNVLQDKATPAQKAVVTANAGLAIQVIRPEQSLEDCLAEARESIESGRAYEKLQQLVK
jgi:anthranilate phosphoribosyltransferase